MAEVQNKQVYQFKITLKGTKPIKIWRRIQVPEEYSFYELSHAILNVMGWHGGHLHDFKMKNPETGLQEVIRDDPDNLNSCSTLNEKETKIRDFFINNKSKAIYEYDFGDSWVHDVQLQRILPARPSKKYPSCIAGKGVCPPEDCGGTEGYKELLVKWRKSKDERTHDENEELLWYQMDDHYDPEEFDPSLVSFEIFELEDFLSRLKK